MKAGTDRKYTNEFRDAAVKQVEAGGRSLPNQKWLADITYMPTDEGWLYLALVLDLYARKLVG